MIYDHNFPYIRLDTPLYRHRHPGLPELVGVKKTSAARFIRRSYLGLRGFTLGLLQLPVTLGLLHGALTGNLTKMAAFAASALSLGFAAWYTREYFLNCRQNYIQTGEIKSDIDRRPLALTLVGITAWIIATVTFKRPFSTGLVFAGIGAAGYYLRYMLPDGTAPQVTPKRVETDHLNPTLRGMIDTAYRHIDDMRDVQRKLRLKPQEHDIAMQLYSIILHSRRLIAIIAEQPERIRAARQFLVVQLPELATISRAYLDDSGSEDATVRQNFLDLLVACESALFQEKKLLNHNRFQTLDTRMQVLREQLYVKADRHD